MCRIAYHSVLFVDGKEMNVYRRLDDGMSLHVKVEQILPADPTPLACDLAASSIFNLQSSMDHCVCFDTTLFANALTGLTFHQHADPLVD